MKERITQNRKKINSRIGFSSLYKTFRKSIVLHFFLVTITAALANYLIWTNSKMFGEQGGHHHGDSCCSSTGGNSHTLNIQAKSTVGDEEEYGKYLTF